MEILRTIGLIAWAVFVVVVFLVVFYGLGLIIGVGLGIGQYGYKLALSYLGL